MGGPAGLTGWLRANGDSVTRLNRYELGATRRWADTTTPKAMVENLKRFLYEREPKPPERYCSNGCSPPNQVRPRMPAGCVDASVTNSERSEGE
jgi:beta-lactamase class A